jgi:cobalt-zinc-cadmium efflux system membrane fusion protein
MRALLLATALVACGGKSGSDEHRHGSGEHEDEGDEHGEHAEAAPGEVRIDPEMLRDLRVTTARAEGRAAGERVTVLGELEVNQDAYAEIAAPVAARVVKVLVKPGDPVKVGQAVVELHSADLGKARAELQAARARTEVARKALARKRELAAEKLITARELQEAEAEASTAEADLEVARAALRAFGPAEDTSGGPSRVLLRSPVAGEVIERDVVMGQLADPARTLLRVGDLSQLWLTAHVFERDAVRVATGGTATVTFAALPGKSVDATIASIGRQVDASSRTIPVRLDVPNAEGVLRPGMSASVALPLGEASGSVVAVPLASVQRVGTSWAVFLPRKEAGVYEIRNIGRGRELGGEVEVLSGLAPGEAVVVDGAFLLKAEADKARGEGGAHDHH